MSLARPQPARGPRRHHRARSRRGPAIVLVAIALVLVAVVVRLLTLTVPAVAVQRTLPATVRLTGAAPHPDWPATGQAAFAVEGVGSVGSSGGDTPRPIASVAKLMTAYLVLRAHPLRATASGFRLTVTGAEARAERRDAAGGQSVVPVAAGETLSERQLLEALLVSSGDNIARMLAGRVAGSIPAFVAEMNAQAQSLHMDHTTYTDPSGLDASTVSDASDQLRLLRRVIRMATLRRILAEPSITLAVGGTLHNYDPLIAEGYAGKTGSDSAAGGCLAFFKRVRVGGRSLTAVGVVLGQGEGSDTSVILDAAAGAAQNLAVSVSRAIRVHTVLARGATVLSARAADGARGRAVSAAALRVIGWGGLTEPIVVHARRLGPGVRAGQPLGTAALSGRLPAPAGGAHRADARAAARLGDPGFGWRLGHLL